MWTEPEFVDSGCMWSVSARVDCFGSSVYAVVVPWELGA